jgi:hypothetical protein
MIGRVKVVIVLFIIVAIFGIISIMSSYSKVQNAAQEVNKSDQDVKAACIVLKDALINAAKFPESSSDPKFAQQLDYYNSKCAALTGRVT